MIENKLIETNKIHAPCFNYESYFTRDKIKITARWTDNPAKSNMSIQLEYQVYK